MALQYPTGVSLQENPLVVDRPWFKRSRVELDEHLVLKRGDKVYWHDSGWKYKGRIISASPALAYPDSRPAMARVYLTTGQEVLAFADELELVS